MPILALAVLALVILLSVHIFRTGRSKMWLPVIWVLPVLGSLIYIFVEMLPQLFRADPPAAGDDPQSPPRPGRATVSREAPKLVVVQKQPEREDSVHETLQLAEASLEQGQFEEADALFGKVRDTAFAQAPEVRYGQARARFGRGDMARGDMASVIALLDDLTQSHPAFQPHALAILKARATARLGDVTAALAQLQAVLAEPDNLEGKRLEAQYRYAEILWQAGEIEKARAALTDIQRYEKLFRVGEDERHWIRLATQALQAIS